MTTLQLDKISKGEAVILLEKYYEIIEDIEDYFAIKKFEEDDEKNFLNDNEVENLFSSINN